MLKQQQQAAAGCGEIAKSRWRFSACGGDRWHYRQEPGGPFDRLPSRSPQPPRWQRGPPRKKPSTPSPVALLPQLRLLLVDGFPARTSTCARVGTGVVGGSACRRRAPGSLSLSLAGARQPARARQYGLRWRQQEGAAAAGATHLQSALGQLLRAWSSSTGEVTGSAAPAAAGVAGSCIPQRKLTG